MTEGITVLVVDDEPDVRWVLEMILLKNGFVVALAASGQEAMQWLHEHSFQLMLVDAKLNDIEGLELIIRIRNETTCLAPAILVSGFFYADDAIIKQRLKMGHISAFVAKPFRHDEIIKSIRAVLMRGGYASTVATTP